VAAKLHPSNRIEGVRDAWGGGGGSKTPLTPRPAEPRCVQCHVPRHGKHDVGGRVDGVVAAGHRAAPHVGLRDPLLVLDNCGAGHLWSAMSAVQCSAVQCSAVQCSAVQCVGPGLSCGAGFLMGLIPIAWLR
jgi:hypothetical protein